MPRTLIAVTLYKDHQRASEMLETLTPPLHVEGEDRDYILVLDGCGDHPGTVPESVAEKQEPTDYLTQCFVYRDYHQREGLPRVLNDAADVAGKMNCDYFAWVHPDMDFRPDPSWLDLCIRHLEEDPECGKASPVEVRTYTEACQVFSEVIPFLAPEARKPILGNACPWVMRVSDIKELIAADGYFFDPGYDLLGFEDWDLINRIVTRLGKRAHILPWTVVAHEGMGTRKDQDYGDSFARNQARYIEKWGTAGFHL